MTIKGSDVLIDSQRRVQMSVKRRGEIAMYKTTTQAC